MNVCLVATNTSPGITTLSTSAMPTDVLPFTLRYSVYLFHQYGDAINAVYENHDSDDFRYYFSCNGPMHILCERVQYADVWITSEQSSVSASTK